MNCLKILALSFMLILCFSCTVTTDDWPDRRNRTPPEMLEDVILWQQLKNVRESTGTLDFQCFTDRDFAVFQAEDRPTRIAADIQKAKDFDFLVEALRALPREALTRDLAHARSVARPTWLEMGFIDKTGRGQTEAGHAADLEIADTITRAFAARLDLRAAPARPSGPATQF